MTWDEFKGAMDAQGVRGDDLITEIRWDDTYQDVRIIRSHREVIVY